MQPPSVANLLIRDIGTGLLTRLNLDTGEAISYIRSCVTGSPALSASQPPSLGCHLVYCQRHNCILMVYV